MYSRELLNIIKSFFFANGDILGKCWGTGGGGGYNTTFFYFLVSRQFYGLSVHE